MNQLSSLIASGLLSSLFGSRRGNPRIPLGLPWGYEEFFENFGGGTLLLEVSECCGRADCPGCAIAGAESEVAELKELIREITEGLNASVHVAGQLALTRGQLAASAKRHEEALDGLNASLAEAKEKLREERGNRSLQRDKQRLEEQIDALVSRFNASQASIVAQLQVLLAGHDSKMKKAENAFRNLRLRGIGFAATDRGIDLESIQQAAKSQVEEEARLKAERDSRIAEFSRLVQETSAQLEALTTDAPGAGEERERLTALIQHYSENLRRARSGTPPLEVPENLRESRLGAAALAST